MKSVVIRKNCTLCKTGEMTYAGSGYSNLRETMYVNKCGNCGLSEYLNTKYPFSYTNYSAGPIRVTIPDFVLSADVEERWE